MIVKDYQCCTVAAGDFIDWGGGANVLEAIRNKSNRLLTETKLLQLPSNNSKIGPFAFY